MLRWALGAALLLPFWFAAPAQAAVTADNFSVATTGDLVALCLPEQGDPMMMAAVGFCHGYATGVYQALQEEETALPHPLFCMTGAMPTRSQAIASFIGWARSKPGELGERPADAVLRFLQERYPCPGAGR